MTTFPVPDAALVPDPDAQWWQRPTPQRPWQPVAPAALGALPAGTQLCRGGEQRVRSVEEARGCWCRPPGAAGPGHWVDTAAAKDAWARGEELWWPGAAAWARAPAAVPMQPATPAEVQPAAATVEVQPVAAAPWPTGPLPRSSYTINGHSFEMVRVPPGTFIMGSPLSEEGRQNNEDQVEVTLTRAFEVGVFPVTQALWQLVMRGNPSAFATYADSPRRPVAGVTWFDVVRFCNAASKACGLGPAYTIGGGDAPSVECSFKAPGFRLPTEAEREYAAWAGEAHRFAGSDDYDKVAWSADNSGRHTQPVGEKSRNAWGLHDMSGNVWEWCWDWYAACLPGGVDPVGPASGKFRAFRGGAYDEGSWSLRIACRWYVTPTFGRSNRGFRLVRTVP